LSNNPLSTLSNKLEDALPHALLPYQQRWIADPSPFKIMEKGRRTGITWGEASDDVLIAAAEKSAGGQNVYYIGTDQEMTEEYIQACSMWAKVFNRAASEIEEGLWEEEKEDRHIKTFSIRFPGSGHKIIALASRPRKLRGRQGVLVGDEAAFQDDLGELTKAAMAFLIWGGKVRLISTHDGEDNPFNELINDVRAGKRKGTVHRVTFNQAVEEGLYKRVCLRRGIPWKAEEEANWVADVYAYYGTDADEELDVIPSSGSGIYLSSALIQSRMLDGTPLVRGHWESGFALRPENFRKIDIEDWCAENLLPHLRGLDLTLATGFGLDFGRLRDLTVMPILQEQKNLVTKVKLWIELSNCPFRQQEQILSYVVDRLPRFRKGAMDATGNGLALAEYAQQKYGTLRIEAVKLSDSFYIENMPHFQAAFQDGTLQDIPRDDEIRDDLRAIKKIRGVPKIGNARTARGDDKQKQRHGDGAIGLFLADYAMRQDISPIEFTAAPEKRSRWDYTDEDSDEVMQPGGGW
jgi:phage FluMu gp28-like protein